MKNLFYFCAVLALVFVGCKKKSKETPTPETPTLSGYYMKATVNGTLVETVDGQNNYTIADVVASGATVSYSCSFQQLTVSNEKYFQLSFNNVDVLDGDDSDELQTYFTVGTDSLNKSTTPYYSLNYTDENGKFYRVKPNTGKIDIQIETVTDLGKQTISQAAGGNSKKRVVKLTGKIPSARLYEFDFNSFTYTGGYADITNLSYVIRFTSSENMP